MRWRGAGYHARVSRALAVLLLASACGGVSEPRWTFRFESEATAASATLVRARILEGGCDGAVTLHEVELVGDVVPDRMPPLLDDGRYGFAGEALDDACVVVASACVEVDLPQSAEIVVELADGPGTALCPAGTCNAGRCDDRAVVDVAAGRAHTCAADYSGTVSCWGRNETGQVGDGTTSDRSTPVTVAEGVNVGGLATGGILTNWRSHSCAIDDGSVVCWGYNGQGQVGDGTNVDRARPTPIELSDVSSLSAGGRHTCAATDDGTLWCWGDDDFGQLGVPGEEAQTSPQRVGAISNVVQVCAGQDHTCARTFAGTVDCWGRNESGQLGLGDTVDRDAPARAFGTASARAVHIACGEAHTCLVVEDGSVRCWGNNDRGQAGQAVGASVSAPAIVALDDAVELALGGKVSCARRRSGVVSCWGANMFGQLGRGDTGGTSSDPVDVAEITDALRIAYGSDHGCAIRASGELWCWGRNQWGRLGDGTTEDRPTPVPILP